MKIAGAYKDVLLTYAYLNGIPVPEEYTTAFLNTNEPLGQYYKVFPIEGGRVLTVAASGDHILQAVCNGAREIDAFDKNKIALYFAKLKVAAVKALDQWEFSEYYKDFENMSYYRKVRKYLDLDVRIFFDALYSSKNCEEYIDYLVDRGFLVENSKGYYAFDENYKYISIDKAFQRRFEIVEVLEPNYEKTKNNLERVKINYYLSTLHTVLDKTPPDSRYDAVFLSNIYNWLRGDEMLEFNSFLENILSKVLTDEGMIAVYASPYEEVAYIEEYKGSIKKDDEKVYVYHNNGRY